MVDLAGNRNDDNLDIKIVEFPDVVPPEIVNVTLDLSNGGTGCGFIRCAVLQFEFSEFINNDFSAINISTVELIGSASGEKVHLGSAMLSSSFEEKLSITLTEEQRIRAIRITNRLVDQPHVSNDTETLLLTIGDGFVIDRGALALSAVTGKSIIEIPDNDPPKLLNASVDLATGVLQAVIDETIDGLNVHFENVFLSNTSGGKDLDIFGATFSASISSILSIQLTEAQRVHAIEISGTRGGDGITAFLEVADGGFFDVAGNTMDAIGGLLLNETQDDTPPVLEEIHFNFLTGEMKFICSETIIMRSVNQTSFRLSTGNVIQSTILLFQMRQLYHRIVQLSM